MKTNYKIMCGLAVAGVTLSACFLSFGGVFALPVASTLFLFARPDIIAALSSFFAGSIEGTIYYQNALVALNFSLKRSIAKRLLKKLYQTNRSNSFLQNYIQQMVYLHNLEEGLDNFKNHLPDQLNEEIPDDQESDQEKAEREIATVKKRLEMMENLFLTRVLKKKDELIASPSPIENEIDQLIQSNASILANIESEVNKKGWYLSFSHLASAMAGLCCSFVTLGSFHGNVISMGYQFASTLFIGGAVISAFAGVGYFFLMCRTLNYLMQSEAMKNWCHKAKKFYQKENKNGWDYLNVLLLTLFVIVAIIATITTAGTWFSLGAFGGSLITQYFCIPPVVTTFLTVSTWACMLMPTLLYNVLNTIKSICEFPEMFWSFCRRTSQDIRYALANENFLQLLNPPRILMKLSTCDIFIGHVFSTGVASASDNNPMGSAEFATAVNTATEATTDLNQIMGSPDRPYRPGEEDDDDDDDDHDQSSTVLDYIELFFKQFAIGWDAAAGNWFGVKQLINCFLSESQRFTIYTMEQATAKFSPTKPLTDAPALSNAWVEYEIMTRVDEQIQYYDEKGITSKKELFSLMKGELELSVTPSVESAPIFPSQSSGRYFLGRLTEILPKKPVDSKQTPPSGSSTKLSDVSSTDYSLLSKHRNLLSKLFSSSPPRSQQFTDNLRRDRCFMASPAA